MRLLVLPTVLALLASQTSAISRQECIDQGGVVVGDIGDGAIFTPSYICEIDGNPPTDPITPLEGEPIAIEGEICCGGTGLGIAYTMVDLPDEGHEGVMLPEMTDEECLASGGVVIEDVSTISAQLGEYLCEFSGSSPIGAISRQATDTDAVQTVCCQSIDPSMPADRDEMSRQECLDADGVIVGDIGNGAIFNPDYICESSGLPPIANIVNTEAPFAIEGEVCCAGAGSDPDDNSSSLPEPAERDEMSREECLDADGVVVGDIGDGAIFHDDYVCESSSLPPIANIVNTEAPFAIEGEVCCASEGIPIMETEREQVSRQECEERGGEIVGDIGDGAIHRDDYLCESNGEPPVAQVIAQDGEPIAYEGEVCCGPSEFDLVDEDLEAQQSNLLDGSSQMFSWSVVVSAASFMLWVLN